MTRQELREKLAQAQAEYDTALAEIDRLTAAETGARDDYMAANNRVGLAPDPGAPLARAAQEKREALARATAELAEARRGFAPLVQALDAAKRAYKAAGGGLKYNPSEMVSPLELP